METVKHFSGFEVRFESTPNGLITNGADLARCLYFSNPAQSVVDNVWSEYRFKHRNGVGAPSWYLTEPGVWQLIFKADHQLAVKIQRWVFEEVLPAIRAKGGYISPDATHEQVTALQNELSKMQKRLEITQSLMHSQHEHIEGLESSLEMSDKLIADTVGYYKTRLAAVLSQPKDSETKKERESLPGWVKFADKLNTDSASVISFLNEHKRFTLLDFLKAQKCSDDAHTQRCAGHLLRKMGYSPKQVRENGTRVSYWTPIK